MQVSIVSYLIRVIQILIRRLMVRHDLRDIPLGTYCKNLLLRRNLTKA